MSLIEAVALGLLQGLTEFFPVSSSGHLVLAEAILGVNPPGVFLEVVVHLATVGAVVVVYGRQLSSLLVGAVRGDRDALRYITMLAVATVPAAAVGVGLAEAISVAFDRPMWAAVNLIVTGFIVYSTRWLIGRGARKEPGLGGSIFVGLAQAWALLPGISRSGATVAAALAGRCGREEAAQFSFLLSIPAILGAAALELPGAGVVGASVGGAAIVAASITAFAAGVLAILLFVRWLRTGHFHRFAFYCWAVGGSYIAYGLIVR